MKSAADRRTVFRLTSCLGLAFLGISTLLFFPLGVTVAAPAGATSPLVSDSRLAGALTLRAKARPLDELLADLSSQLKLSLTASREVVDDKATLYLQGQQAGETLTRMATHLGYVWVKRGKGYELQRDLAWWQAAQAAEERRGKAALARLPDMVRLYEEQVAKDPEELERLVYQLDHDLAQETDPARREQMRQLRWVASDLAYPGVRNFVQILQGMTPEARQELAAGHVARVAVKAKGPAGEPLQFNIQVNQEVEGGRARWTFVAPAAISIDGSPPGPDEMEWQLGTLPDTRLSPSTGASSPGSSTQPRTAPGTQATQPASELLMRRVSLTVQDGQGPTEQEEATAVGRPSPQPVEVESKAAGEAVVRVGRRVQATSADFAEALALAGAVPVLADAYTRPVVIARARRETLQQVLERFCEQNDYQWGIEDGIVLLRSGAAALDRRRELPERHVRRWLKESRGKRPLPLGTVVDMAATLSDDQLEKLEERWPLYAKMPESYFAVSGGVSPWKSRAGLRFYASLAAGQRQAAATRGLAFTEMLPEQRQLFATVFAEDPRTGQARYGSPEEITTGSFRLRPVERMVLLVSRNGRASDPVDADLEREIREGSALGRSRLAAGRLPATISTLQFGFYVGGQATPRVLFQYQGEPVPWRGPGVRSR
jgi:hypothetical protein